MKKGSWYTHTVALPALILILVFLLPVSFTLSRAFVSKDGFTLGALRAVFFSSYTWRLLFFTFKQAALSALASLLIATPGILLYSNYNFKGRTLILSLANLCFVLPSILVVLGFVIFFGNSGVLNRFLTERFALSEPPLQILYSFKAIILAHAFLNFPIALSLITDAYSHLSARQEKAAATMGASKTRVFFTITLRRLTPSILSTLLLIFLFCFNSFSIILVLGGGPEFTTLEVEIYRRANLTMKYDSASALAIFSFLFNFLLLLLYSRASAAAEGVEKKKEGRLKQIKSGIVRALVIIYSLILLAFILSPILSIVYRSFISSSAKEGAGFSLSAYKMLFGLMSVRGQMAAAPRALFNTLLIALITSGLSTAFALALSLYAAHSKRRLVDVATMFPMAVSSVTLGLGYFFIKTRLPSHSLATGYLLVILAHLVITLPFATRSLLPSCRSLGNRRLWAAYTLKASERRACLTVEVPLLKSAIVKAFMFSFALSAGEVNATLTLAEGRVTTLPILLYRLINSYNYQGACAIGTLLIILTFFIFFISEVFSHKE